MNGDAGALYHIFDVVKVYLANDATRITVPYMGPGMHYIVPYPTVTKDEALESGYTYVFAAGGFLYAETSSALIGNYSSTYNNQGLLGYWAGSAAFEDSTKERVIFKANGNESVTMLGGREYFILRLKQ